MRVLIVSICLLTVPQLAAGQADVVPLLDTKTGAILGSVKGGRFQRDAQTVARRLKGNEEFIFHGILQANIGGQRIIRLFQPDKTCPDFYRADIAAPVPAGIMIGRNPGWDPLIRTPEILWNGRTSPWRNSTYQQLVAAYLKTKGIRNPVVKITQAFRIDIDGDGAMEMVIVANHYRNGFGPRATFDDYSLVLLRKIQGGTVKDIGITGDFFHKDMVVETGFSYREVTAILDLNGDGRLEIVAHAKSHEGSFTEVFELREDEAEVVLMTGCVK